MMYTLLKGSRRAFTTVAQSVSDASITWAALERQYVSYKLIFGIAGVAAGGSVYLTQRATESQIVKAKAEFQKEINNINLGIGQISNSIAKLDTDMNQRFTKIDEKFEQKFKTMECDISALRVDIRSR